jgi:hypothetical protein
VLEGDFISDEVVKDVTFVIEEIMLQTHTGERLGRAANKGLWTLGPGAIIRKSYFFSTLPKINASS